MVHKNSQHFFRVDFFFIKLFFEMFINKVVLYDKYCDIYFNTNGNKSKQLKLKEQLDVDIEILFEGKSF